jgi:hypothetical protein
MSNQTASAIAAVANAVNWERQGLDLQAIIQAGNQGRLGKSLTDWLIAKGWNQGKFTARDKFVVDTSRTAKVKISGLGRDFRKWFLDVVENLSVENKFDTFILPKDMYDKDIIAKIGGVAKVITSLSDMFGRMQLQPEGPNGKAGQLLTNGYNNIFYVPQAVTKLDDNHFSYIGSDGEVKTEELKDSQYLFEVSGQWYVLRVVIVLWDGVGWSVGASSVELPFSWDDGSQAFSRSSVLKSSEPVTAQVP